ncbi:hypothetical protein ACFVZ3_30160 [Kitasatospora purpeofusca]|uniref:hypothetical protein n=1 Tax=Kitasatospora purpeofusca TaxID=67352 RepID=UPI0033EC4158|nr:hypothetical protein KPHV_34430 [Kitasatospora purpeofusca]
MKLKAFAVAGLAAAALGLVAAPSASAASIDGGCSAKAHLDNLGRPTAESTCSGRLPSGAAHRAKITCDVVMGSRETVVRSTYWGPWVGPGQTSSVRCGFKSYLASYSSEVRGA